MPALLLNLKLVTAVTHGFLTGAINSKLLHNNIKA